MPYLTELPKFCKAKLIQAHFPGFKLARKIKFTELYTKTLQNWAVF